MDHYPPPPSQIAFGDHSIDVERPEVYAPVRFSEGKAQPVSDPVDPSRVERI
jgi:hypothetical protein